MATPGGFSAKTPRRLWSLYRDLLLVNLLLLVKIICFNLGFGPQYGTLSMIISSSAILLMLSCLTLMLPVFARALTLVVFDLLVTLILLSDSLFYKFFDKLIPLTVLDQAGEVGGATHSILALLSTRDLLLFGDFLFLIPFLFLLKKSRGRSRPRRLPARTHAVHALSLLTASLLVFSGTASTVLWQNGTSILKDLSGNNTVLQKMGILNYHVADLYNLAQHSTNTASAAPTDQVDTLKTWMQIHRNEGSHNLQGVAKGKNVIMVQMEAMQGFLIGAKINGQEITPNLNRLAQSSLYFDNYFPQIGDGNTSDAEFMTFNSLYPLSSGIVYNAKNQNTYQSLPKMLRQAGYETSAFHNYKGDFFSRNLMYPQEGFDHFYSGDHSFTVDEQIGWGLTDESMYRQAVPMLKQMKQPFFSFFLSLTGHHPYDLPDAKKELKFDETKYSEMLGKYIHVQHYADKALGKLIDDLKQQGLYDNTVFIVYGDHFGAVEPPEIATFLGKPVPNNHQTLELKKVPLLIHLPGDQQAGVKHISGGQMDFYPTVANLLDLDRGHMFYFGQDLLNSPDGFTPFRNRIEKGSFLTNSLFYHANQDGVFDHGVCLERSNDQQLPVAKCESGYKRAMWQWQMSDMILDTNGLPNVLNQ